MTATHTPFPGLDKYDLRAALKPKTKPQSHFLSIIAFDGNITLNTFDSVMLAQQTKKLWQGWKVHAGEGQVRSRNECADLFLKKSGGMTHHDFMDADLQCRPEHWESLRKHPEAADAIIVGLYCKKQDRIEHPYNSIKGGNPAPNDRGLMEIAKGATGFMQIPRTAYERIMAHFPERYYLCDYEIEDGVRAKKYSFFFHDIRMDSELGFMRDQSEDWAFCELARQAGVKIYADVTTAEWKSPKENCIMHRGLALYPLQTELQRMDLEEKLRVANERIAELEGKQRPAA
jgi:hypothetical protein